MELLKEPVGRTATAGCQTVVAGDEMFETGWSYYPDLPVFVIQLRFHFDDEAPADSNPTVFGLDYPNGA